MHADDILVRIARVARDFSRGSEGGMSKAMRIIEVASTVGAAMIRAGNTADDVIQRIASIAQDPRQEIDVEVNEWRVDRAKKNQP